MNFFRQSYILSIKLPTDCNKETYPFIIFDMADMENFSVRLTKPVMPNIMGTASQSSQEQSSSQQIVNNSQDAFSSLSAAGLSIRQSLSRSNQTLKQIREASAEVVVPPSESQMSYKPFDSGPALPPNLQALTRSKPIDSTNLKA